MKKPEEVMEILEAYDLTGSLRGAAALAGCDHKTVAYWVRMRDEAGGMPVVERSRPAMEAVFAAKIDELVDRSHGQIRADAAHDKLVAIGYLGSERTTRRVLAGLASLLTAIGAILALVLTSGGNSNPKSSSSDLTTAFVSPAPGTAVTVSSPTLSQWASEANTLCSQGYDQIHALGITPGSFVPTNAIPQEAAVLTATNAQMGTLERPSDPQQQRQISQSST